MPNAPSLIATLKTSQDPDALVLLQMAELGADLAKPHHPEFAFEIPSSDTAEGIAAVLSSLGYQVEHFDPDEDNPSHQIIAECAMVLELEALNKLSLQFEALAEKYQGSYDGWGAEIVE